MKRIEYSQPVRRKLRILKMRLTVEFGTQVATKVLREITKAVRGLETFEEKGASVTSTYGIECDYRYLFVGHNYLFYRIEVNKIIIVEMFDDREDFMYKLFGITTTSQETLEYWDED